MTRLMDDRVRSLKVINWVENEGGNMNIDVELIRWMNSDGSNPQDQDISADSHFIFYIVQIVYPYTDKLLAW